jgi:hypothetical protein
MADDDDLYGGIAGTSATHVRTVAPSCARRPTRHRPRRRSSPRAPTRCVAVSRAVSQCPRSRLLDAPGAPGRVPSVSASPLPHLARACAHSAPELTSPEPPRSHHERPRAPRPQPGGGDDDEFDYGDAGARAAAPPAKPQVSARALTSAMAGGGARPGTASTKAAGYGTRGPGGGTKSAAPALARRADDGPDERCREMEAKVHLLLEESARLGVAGDAQGALERARACVKEEKRLTESARPGGSARAAEPRPRVCGVAEPGEPAFPRGRARRGSGDVQGDQQDLCSRRWRHERVS